MLFFAVGAIVAARREADADHLDRRVDGLERVVRGGEVRAERRRGRVLPGGVELRAPEERLVRLVPDDELLDLRVDRREHADVRRRTCDGEPSPASISRGGYGYTARTTRSPRLLRARDRAVEAGLVLDDRWARSARSARRSRSGGDRAPDISPYIAAPPSSAYFAESSFAPMSAATPTDAPQRSATVRAVAATRIRISPPERAPHCPQRRASLESREEGVKQEPARRSGRGRPSGRPVSTATSSIARARLVVGSSSRVFSAMHATLALRRAERDPLVQLDELRERRDRVPGTALDLGRTGRVAEHEERAAPTPWTSPSVTPEYSGWTSEPCPSTKRSFPPRRAPSTTSHSAAPARKSETTASTAIPQPAIAIPVWPVGTKTDSRPRLPRLEVELDRDRLLPDRAVGADGEDDRRVDLEVRAGRDVEALGRLPQVAQLDAVLARERRQLGIVGDELVQPALDVEPGRDATPSEARATPAGSGHPASRRRRRRPSARTRQRVLDRRRRSGCPRGSSPARCESRIATTGSGPVADDPAHRLAVVRVVREALAEDRGSAAARSSRRAPRGPARARAPGRRRRARRPGHGSSREQEVPVEVDVVAERRDAAAGGDPEPRLEHAAEHHAHPQRARRVRHADRLPDPARLARA